MRKVLNLIATDVGRPIGDFSLALAGRELLADVETVLKQLAPVQREFKSENGSWYLRRVLPYRTESDHISGAVITFLDITESKRAAEAAVEARKTMTESLEARVRERTAQLRALAHELAMTEARERRALAQDLHDDIGQTLAIARLKLAQIEKGDDVEKVRLVTREVIELVEQANKSARSLIFQLSPPILYELGLVPALEWLAEDMRARYGLDVAVHDDGLAKALDQAVSVTLFRAVRELLINVAKHAKVGSARLTLRRQDARLKLMVEDAGGGFDYDEIAGQSAGGFGLLSIRERIDFLGGAMEVAATPGDGTVVTLTVPLAAAAAKEGGA
jgi:two-component system, chemotaxis family, CheB/CheR fusion protein